MLSENLYQDPVKFSGAWNFGPEKSDFVEVDFILKEIIRIRVYIKDNKYFLGQIGQILGKYFGNIRPANTTVVTGFVDDQIKIEIEVTAKRF